MLLSLSIKWMCALAAAVVFGLACWMPPSAAANAVGPIAALEAVCVHRWDGTWSPYERPGVGKVVCDTPGVIVPDDDKRLQYLDSLCKAAGYSGAQLFGKGIPVPGIFVAVWSCN